MSVNDWRRAEGNMLLARRFDGGDMRCAVLGCVVAAVMAAPVAVAGQWLKYPMEGLPRNADGSLNRNAPTPRLPGGSLPYRPEAAKLAAARVRFRPRRIWIAGGARSGCAVSRVPRAPRRQR